MGGFDEKYAINSDPAYYEKRRTYRVETSVYSINEALLAWVAYSDTVDPESVEGLIGAVSINMAKRMKADVLIKELRSPPEGSGGPHFDNVTIDGSSPIRLD
jgi:hypothetical protein